MSTPGTVTPLTCDVFFYGLFMDAAVLEAKGVHGVVTTVPLPELDRLYAEASVQMYRPVAVLVEAAAADAAPVAALAYVLPEPPAPEERNPEYTAKLRALTERLGLPGHYTRSIG